MYIKEIVLSIFILLFCNTFSNGVSNSNISFPKPSKTKTQKSTAYVYRCDDHVPGIESEWIELFIGIDGKSVTGANYWNSQTEGKQKVNVVSSAIIYSNTPRIQGVLKFRSGPPMEFVVTDGIFILIIDEENTQEFELQEAEDNHSDTIDDEITKPKSKNINIDNEEE